MQSVIKIKTFNACDFSHNLLALVIPCHMDCTVEAAQIETNFFLHAKCLEIM